MTITVQDKTSFYLHYCVLAVFTSMVDRHMWTHHKTSQDTKNIYISQTSITLVFSIRSMVEGVPRYSVWVVRVYQ